MRTANLLLLYTIFLSAVLLFGCIGGRNETLPSPTPVRTPTPTPTPLSTPTPTATQTPFQTPGPECATDADCAPAQCCHPLSCVPAAAAPNCEGMACTLECGIGTMDCGQGRCVCVEGRCGVSYVPTPEPSLAPAPSPTPTPFSLCRSTTESGQWGRRGTTLGDYNGRYGLYEDSCMWNGTDNVLVKYSCNLINGSNEVRRDYHVCTTFCSNGECDECQCGAGDPNLIVCAEDGRTYPSECYAGCHGTRMVRYGQCPDTCFATGHSCQTSSECCSMKCDPRNRKCAECVMDADCAAGRACRNGTCEG